VRPAYGASLLPLDAVTAPETGTVRQGASLAYRRCRGRAFGVVAARQGKGFQALVGERSAPVSL